MAVLVWRDNDQSPDLDRVMLKADSVAWPTYEDNPANRNDGLVGRNRVFRIVYSKSKRNHVIAFAPKLCDGMKAFDTVDEAKQWCEKMELDKLHGASHDEHHPLRNDC